MKRDFRELKVMSLTDAAAARVKEIIANTDRPVAGLRVGVKNGGCAGMSYTMEFAENVEPLDEIIEDKGVKVLIDPKAVLFLLGAEMDFKFDRLVLDLHVPQSERNLGLRMRRKRRDHARRSFGARSGVVRRAPYHATNSSTPPKAAGNSR